MPTWGWAGSCTAWGRLLLSARIEQGLALYDPQTHTPAVSDAVHDPEVVGRCCAAGALWHLGYPEQARQHLDAALTRAQELAHPFTLAQVFYCATTFALVRREVQVAGERADALITLATAQGFPFQLAAGCSAGAWYSSSRDNKRRA